MNGQAAVLEYSEEEGLEGEEELMAYVDLAKRILRRCAPIVRGLNLGFGVGIYQSHVYTHVFENPELNGKVSFRISALEVEIINAITGQNNTIHQLNTMLSTSKNVLFPSYNHLLTTFTWIIIRTLANNITHCTRR